MPNQYGAHSARAHLSLYNVNTLSLAKEKEQDDWNSVVSQGVLRLGNAENLTRKAYACPRIVTVSCSEYEQI